MSNKSRKNKSSQSPKQETERAREKELTNTHQTHFDAIDNSTPEKLRVSEKAMRKSAEMKEDAKQAVQAVIEHNPNTPFSFETTSAKMQNKITSIAKELELVALELNTETIFGITAARFQTFADKIKNYPKQLENKAQKERRRLTQTETKEEKKEKKATALRNKIEALQTKLAKL